MKATKIYFQETADGKIKIIDFKNAATIEVIDIHCGKEVSRLYTQTNGCRYIAKNTDLGNPTILQIWNGKVPCAYCYTHKLEKGGIYSIEYFNKCLKLMEFAGKRLVHLRKKVKDYKIKTVTI